jgi:hypothetical protein
LNGEAEIMSDALRFLTEGWFGAVVGIIGIALGVIFFVKSQRRAKLAYQYNEVTLIGGTEAAFPAEVEVRFNGVAVPRITASTLFFWNSGQRTIRGEEIVASDPLRVQFAQETLVLKSSILKATREVNGVRAESISSEAHKVQITFDFLDPGDGVALEILHSGGGSQFKVLGTIRGIPKGITNHGGAVWFAARRGRPLPFPLNHPGIVVGLVFVLAIGLMVFGLLRPQIATAFPRLLPLKPDSLTSPDWTLAIITGMYALMTGYIWSNRRKYPAILELRDATGRGSQRSRGGG